MVIKIIIAILIFSFIVIFHELGHLLVAKKCDIKVNEFSLGLGPTLFSFGKGETKYSLKLLPFGGACMMEGEDSESSDDRAFNKKPVWQRFLVVAAGPFNNFILAFVLCVIVIALTGVDRPIVSNVTEGESAMEQGMMPGDEIIKLDSYRIHFSHEVSAYVFFHQDDDIKVTYLRDGEEKEAVVKPHYSENTHKYIIGFEWNRTYEKVNIFKDFYYGMCQMKYYIYSTFKSLAMLVTGNVSFKEMSGPVGIVKVIGDTYEQSKPSGVKYIISNLMNLAALLSANLVVMNLLPIPALDGGRLVFYIVEAIRGKKLNEKIENAVHLVGFALMMLLMLVVMYNDIVKIFVK